MDGQNLRNVFFIVYEIENKTLKRKVFMKSYLQWKCTSLKIPLLKLKFYFKSSQHSEKIRKNEDLNIFFFICFAYLSFFKK